MRTKSFIAAGLVIGVLATSAAVRNSRLPATKVVTIDAKCASPRNTQVTVTPWNITVAQGDDMQWSIDNNANTGAVTITPKDANWPFATNQASGTKAAPARSSGMRANARGRYSYTITLVCQAGASAPDTVRIDPDVIVE
jgi:hypothetical protein